MRSFCGMNCNTSPSGSLFSPAALDSINSYNMCSNHGKLYEHNSRAFFIVSTLELLPIVKKQQQQRVNKGIMITEKDVLEEIKD